MEQVDTVVIGAGVVGLAVARELALRGREVVVLEAASGIGTGISSRNSEVIHAGIYYPQGSLKAQLCVQGKQLLYDYCAARNVGHKRCGKLLVATNAAQAAELPGIIAKAAHNGVTDLSLLTREQARALEPALECVAAIHSPSTGIVDSHALMLALQGDLENAGGVIAFNSPIAGIEYAQAAIKIEATDGTRLRVQRLINAAGLHATEVARCIRGLDVRHVPASYFAKGSYFSLAGRSPFSSLIYPVPEPQARLAGLGLHFTLDLGGQAKFGPDVEWVDSSNDLQVDAARGETFYAEVRKYWPALEDGALIPGYAGIRPKISAPGEPAADFLVQGPSTHGIVGLVNLFGIESPGLTSCLALGKHVADMLYK
jgi:L-2-hydroxyglutarate oxidase LhgO